MKTTLRSIAIGLILVPLNCMWLALAEVVWYSGEPTTLSLYPNVVFILCVLVLGNLALKKLRPAWALSPAELLVIYVMLSVATSLAGHDMMEILVSTLPHLHRYGSLDGRYADVLPHVPRWLVVTDPHALESAYVGQESIFDPRNFGPWLAPLAWWFGFIIALCAVMWGLILVFRKQWTEHEKLAYPIIQVPMMLTTQLETLLRSKVFWIAFSIAAGIDVLNGLNVLFPMLPRIPIVRVVNLQSLFPERPWRDMGGAWISFFPCIIGMCFLMPLDLAFSCWFFFWFWKLQQVAASQFGMHGMPGFPFVHEQAVGGFYAVALLALWVTRRQLRRMVLLLMGRTVDGATSWERHEARLAALLIAGGAAFLYYFCARAQMTWWVILAFFTIYFLMSIAITRMRAELGPPSHDIYPVGAHRQLVEALGAVDMRRRNPHDLAMFGFLNFFNRVCRTHPMPHGMEGFRIAERLGLSNARMFAAMALAVVTGTLGAFFALLWSFNRYGIAAQVSQLAGIFGTETWEAVNGWFNSPVQTHSGPTYALGIGTVFALGLAFLRMSLTWWPLHPVGYAISASYTMERLWFCVFIAWLVKALVLKYGGAKHYQPALHFFVGLIIGDFLVGSFWYTYGIVMECHVYHFWPY